MKKLISKYTSNCCNASIQLYYGKEGTSFWICSACDNACDRVLNVITQTQNGTDIDSKPKSYHFETKLEN